MANLHRYLRWVLVPSALLVTSGPLAAQAAGPAGGRSEVFVNSELERYLRVLQVAGDAELYPWSLRGFSPAEVDRMLRPDSAHPWARRYDLAGRPPGPALQLDWIHPRADLRFNSAFPYGPNDGPVWAGRGVTLAGTAGIAARYRGLSMVVAPQAFYAQNAGFELQPNGEDGRLAFADGLRPQVIDLPQRFGDGPVTRLDPGQSTIRLDARGVALGLSSANQHWGPAHHHPIVLGSNAPGFAHAFLGTASPASVGIGRLHGRMVWGRLEQSPYSPAPADSAHRFMAGLVGMFLPRGVPGLEVGFSRFYHLPWPADGVGSHELLRPIEAFMKVNTANPVDELELGVENQLASVFLRWAFPRSGFEVYGEYGREDHSWDVRDFLLEPDHSAAYLVGLGKVWRQAPERLLSVRAELMSARVGHIVQARPQGAFYYHVGIRQGHTHRGQLLGSSAGYGGSGSVVAADYYHPAGRWTARWGRAVRQPGTWRSHELPEPEGLDVTNAASLEAVRFHGPWDLSAGVTGMYVLNRNFEDDAVHVNLTLGFRRALGLPPFRGRP